MIVEKADGTVAGVEVKTSATVSAGDFTGLQGLRDQLGRRFCAGVVLYGEQRLPFGDKLWALPIESLWSS